MMVNKRNEKYKIMQNKIPSSITIKNIDQKLYFEYAQLVKSKGLRRIEINRELFEKCIQNFIDNSN